MNTAQRTLPAVSLAHYCLNRMKNGEPVTAGFLNVPKCNTQKPEFIREYIEYRDDTGQICSQTRAAEILNVSERRTAALFTKYHNRWALLYQNHSPKRKYNGVKTRCGTPSSLAELAKIYQCSCSTISRAFTKHPSNHIKAHQELQHGLQNRHIKQLAEKFTKSGIQQ